MAAVLAVFVVVSCARQVREPRAALLAPEAPFASPRCVLDSATRTTTIGVDPGAGVPGFDVVADRAKLVVAPDGGWEARVIEPLSFHGATDEPELVTARAVEHGGLVHLEPGRRVDSVRGDASVLVARAWLASSADEPGSIEIAVDDVRFACDDLRVAGLGDQGGRPLRPVDLWAPARMADVGSIELRDTPHGRGARLVVHGDGLFVHVLERDAAAALVVLQWSDGSRVRGWVDASELREPDPDETLRIGRVMGGLAALDVGALAPLSFGSTAFFEWERAGLGGLRRRPSWPPTPQPIRARIAPGTPVYAAPGRARWATVTGDAVFFVGARPTCEWVSIERAPGFVLPPLRAWVRADALRIGR